MVLYMDEDSFKFIVSKRGLTLNFNQSIGIKHSKLHPEVCNDVVIVSKVDVFIADAVVEEIAALAAGEIEGVEGIVEKAKNKSLIKADIAGTNVKISMIISTRFGYPIPATCQAVQSRVKQSVENMTGLTCTDVNIRVSGVEI